MKIVLLTNYYPPEVGAASHLYHELAKALTSRGHAVTVVTGYPRYNYSGDLTPGELNAFDAKDGAAVKRIPVPSMPKASRLARGLEHLLVAAAFSRASISGADVCLVYSPPLTLGLTAMWFSRRYGVPFVLNVQDLFPQSAIDLGVMHNPVVVRAFELLERWVYKRAGLITVHSEGNREHVLRKGARPDKAVVMPNWVNTDEISPQARLNDFREERGYSPDDFIVSFAGTMGYSQDIEIILQAANLLRDIGRIKFLLVGDGVQRAAAVSMVERMGLWSVGFAPMQPKERYPAVLAASDVGLVTLRREVITPVVPSKLLSIMASGRPVVASMDLDGDAPQIIRDANCGVVIPPGDSRALADAIRQLYEDSALCSSFGNNGRRFVVEKYSVQACAMSYETLFGSLRSRMV